MPCAMLWQVPRELSLCTLRLFLSSREDLSGLGWNMMGENFIEERKRIDAGR